MWMSGVDKSIDIVDIASQIRILTKVVYYQDLPIEKTFYAVPHRILNIELRAAAADARRKRGLSSCYATPQQRRDKATMAAEWLKKYYGSSQYLESWWQTYDDTIMTPEIYTHWALAEN